MTDALAIAMLIAFGLIILMLYVRLHRIKKQTKEVEDKPAIPPAVRAASHDLNNQVMRLRSGLNQIARSKNPLEALVDALNRGNGNGHVNR